MKRRPFLFGAMALAAGRPAIAAQQVILEGAAVTLDISGDASAEFADLVRHWVRKSARAVAIYYGKFPVPEIEIRIATQDGSGVRGGQTFPGEVPVIRVRVGRESAEHDLLASDWVMVHEMIHLAFPWMDLEHNWMAEGLAVYVESIARVQAGHLPSAQIWHDFVTMMPRGLPHEGDGGFEVTRNHGRTYWGGAMFCLLADVRIRQETGNRFGLQHALRAINARRDFRRQWDFDDTLKIGDAATGRKVLMTQYDEMKMNPVKPDLDDLWRQLGVMVKDERVEFDAAAPLAAIRSAIETPLP